MIGVTSYLDEKQPLALDSYNSIRVFPLLGWWNGRHWGLKIPWVNNPCGFDSHFEQFRRNARKKATQRGFRVGVEVRRTFAQTGSQGS